jgi:hypothetical protein
MECMGLGFGGMDPCHAVDLIEPFCVLSGAPADALFKIVTPEPCLYRLFRPAPVATRTAEEHK